METATYVVENNVRGKKAYGIVLHAFVVLASFTDSGSLFALGVLCKRHEVDPVFFLL